MINDGHSHEFIKKKAIECAIKADRKQDEKGNKE